MTDKNKIAYINKYNKKTYRQVMIHINYKTEADMLEHLLSQDSINSYVKGLIRDDMNRAKQMRI